MLKNMSNLLIVGAGFTGSNSAVMLKNRNIDIEVWEKSRGAGGRMNTSRCVADTSCTADVGAQYISATPSEYCKYQSYYDELVGVGVLSPLKGLLEGDDRPSNNTKDFVAPQGINSVVKYNWSKSGATVRFNHRVADISQDGAKWKVTADSGKSQCYDAVMLTMPVPQILQLQGSIRTILDQQPVVRQKLEAVRYSSRYALALFYSPGTKINVPWCAKFVDNDDCVRFVAIDNKKRNIESDEIGPSVVVHTSVPFGIKHLEDNMEDVCNNIVLPRVLGLIPELPKPDSIKAHKWRYSQVSTPYDGQPGAIVLHRNPLLLCAGDGFVKSGFNGCLQSAITVTDLVIQHTQL